MFAEPNKIENANFAIHESDKILNAISDYLQVNFSLPKMDQAAIPQFEMGGKNSIHNCYLLN